MSEAEILEGFLSTFYAEHAAPKEILISEPLANAEFLENSKEALKPFKGKEGWTFSSYYINDDRKTDGWVLGVKRYSKI